MLGFINRAFCCGLLVWLVLFSAAHAAEESSTLQADAEADKKAEQAIESLKEPLYSAFIERYMLDEIKQLRVDMAEQKHELMQQVIDREHKSVDRAVSYATDTITYFFYLIAGASSILVLVGWSSIREIKDRVHTLADEEIAKLIKEYEQRLYTIEKKLNQKTIHIDENREEIELTQEIQSLWLRAAQEQNPSAKIAVYDDILKRRNDNTEALTYKADSVLELNEPQWAANLCHQALKIDPQNSHAFYQLACAYTAMNHYDDAVNYLEKTLALSDSYRDEITSDPALTPLANYQPFNDLIKNRDETANID